MNEHSRFNDEHRAKCSDCYEAYLDFMDEQRDEQRLDAMAELETMGVL